ncbi:MAG: cytochrome-c peroxidase [Deltaproteobacteria bacterium]|nr:MAG: cytochrome-c peroxidase [Deltaproteobacteria bacterium]
MKNLIILLTLVFVTPLIAQDLDTELRALLKTHSIEPLKKERDLTSPLFDLGHRLFVDNRLSGNNNISCRDCHHPMLGTSDSLPLPIGEGGEGIGTNRRMGTGAVIPRNAPHLFNSGLSNKEVSFWDGRVSYDPLTKTFQTPEPAINGANPTRPEIAKALSSALAAQAMFPPLSHEEMRGQPGSNEIADAKTNIEAWDLLTERITDDQVYMDLFKKAIPGISKDKINFGHIGEALAHFQANRFAVTNTPFDKYLAGDNSAMSDAAKRGAILFYTKAKCVECHSGNNFTDNKFHNIAIPQVGPGKEVDGNDKGLYAVTGKEEDLYKFKTPGLRNVSKSAPYGHSGSLKTLLRVVQHYQMPMRSNHHYEGGYRNLPYALEVDWKNMNDRLRRLDPLVPRMGLPLDGMEMQDIVTFMEEGLTQQGM